MAFKLDRDGFDATLSPPFAPGREAGYVSPTFAREMLTASSPRERCLSECDPGGGLPGQPRHGHSAWPSTHSPHRKPYWLRAQGSRTMGAEKATAENLRAAFAKYRQSGRYVRYPEALRHKAQDYAQQRYQWGASVAT